MLKEESEQIVNMEEQSVERLLLRLKQHLEKNSNVKTEDSKQDIKNIREQVRDKLFRMKKGEMSIDFDAISEHGKVMNMLKTTIDVLEKKLKKMELQCTLKDDKIRMMEKIISGEN